MKNRAKKATYISVAELAKMLGISRIAVFKKIKKGQIPAEKIGRSYVISMKNVDDLLNHKQIDVLTEDRKEEIKTAVQKVIKEYGETLKLLGKE